MGTKGLKGIALLAVLGTVFQFGGCLGGKFWRDTIWSAVGYTGFEFVLDNDSVLDIFEDDGNNVLGL